MDWDRAAARGGRRLLLDRPERDRPRAGAVRACRSGAWNDRGRACLRPVAAGIPLLPPRPAPSRLGLAATIARHYLYETADEERIGVLKQSEDAELAGLAAKIDREEAYHRMHA